ncbi:MAG: type II restriction endonuclease [Lachnospiraceae bacterium]|nr:type II restriction endonuclease [Lachnospiraceae bacterium]
MRNFDEWLKTFTDNINNWNYYVNYNTAYKNTAAVKRQLALLNTLKGAENIEDEFRDLVKEYPECLKAIPLLLAVRENVIAITENDRRLDFNFNKMNYSVDLYVEFMQKTGIFELLQSHVIGDLLDVGLGINIGLDSNARKNRGGDQMEDLVEFFIKAAGFEKDVTYFKEMYLEEVEKKWGYNLSAISAEGTATKRFDFVVKPMNSREVYICECNCYSSSGSKLNETARSFKTISLEAKDIQHVHFVWFTDGAGWLKTKKNLKETYDVQDDIYNINDLKNGIIKERFV